MRARNLVIACLCSLMPLGAAVMAPPDAGQSCDPWSITEASGVLAIALTVLLVMITGINVSGRFKAFVAEPHSLSMQSRNVRF